MNYLFYGKDSGKIQKEISKVIEQFENDCDVITYDLNVHKMGEILNELTTPAFFKMHKVIIIRHCNFLASGAVDFDSSQLEAFLKQPLLENILIMTGDFEKCDSRKKIVKLVNQTCRVKCFKYFDEKDKRSYVMEKCEQLDIEITPQALNELVDRLSVDSSMIDLQLEKLACYPLTVDEKVVQALILKETEENVFIISEALMKHHFHKAYQVYRDMISLSYDPIYLLAVLSSQMRFYYQVKICMMQGKSEEQCAYDLKAHPYRVKLTMQIVRNVNADTIMKILNKAFKCDLDIKNGRREKFLAFEMFLISCQEEMK